MDIEDIFYANLNQIEQKIGYHFKTPNFIRLAFTHASAVHGKKDDSYERLEFLGDSILGFIVAEYLFTKDSIAKEGKLTSQKAQIVQKRSLSAAMERLDLFSFVIRGKGQEKAFQEGKESILCDLFESILASIYLDGGLDQAKKFVFDKLISLQITQIEDYKSRLQELIQQKCGGMLPQYESEEKNIPNHHFKVAVWVGVEKLAEGEGKNKAQATQQAAKNALKILEEVKKIEF